MNDMSNIIMTGKVIYSVLFNEAHNTQNFCGHWYSAVIGLGDFTK